jgi:signal transduction histidine kinase
MSYWRIRKPGLAGVLRAACLAAVAVSVPLLAWNGLTQQLNASLGDVVMRLGATAAGTATGQIVVLAVDDVSLAAYGPLPLRRSYLARALEELAEAQPRVLVVDLLLAGEQDLVEDKRVAAALSRIPRRVLASAIQQSAPEAPEELRQPGWILPFSLLVEGAALGHAHAEPDADGVVRSVLLRKTAAGHSQWALGLQATRLNLDAEAPLETEDALLLGAHRIPCVERQSYQLLVNYAGAERTVSHIPIREAIEGRLNRVTVAGKIVIVGVTAQGGGDRRITPLSSGIGMSGAEIHANVIRTILDDAYLVQLEPLSELIGCLIVCGLPVWVAWRYRGTKLIVLLAMLGLFLPVLSYLAFRFGLILPLGSFSVLFVVAAVLAVAGEYGVAAGQLRVASRRQKEYASRVQAIAHEIKTPLTAIQGSSEIIYQSALSEEKRARLAGLIHRESKRLTELVHTFLDVERMAAGALKLQAVSVPVAEMCEEAAERARLLAERKQIRIQCDAHALAMEADRELLGFAIYNLLSNAVKYSPPGTTVHLTADGDERTIRIAVSDEGYGIAAEEQPYIFERFYRAHARATPNEEGSGIGLALVKEIVAQHGGEIAVRSRPGKGSCFTLIIPSIAAAKPGGGAARWDASEARAAE